MSKEIKELIACFEETGLELTVPEVLARLLVIEGVLAEQPAPVQEPVLDGKHYSERLKHASFWAVASQAGGRVNEDHLTMRELYALIDEACVRIDSPPCAPPQPAQPTPEGWRLVPLEPTREMAHAGCYRYCTSFVKDYKDMLAAAPQPAQPEQEPKPPGMAIQALAGEIVEALLADDKDGGYDLTAGLFGRNFSTLVRRWAQAEWSSISSPPPQRKPLTDEQMREALRQCPHDTVENLRVRWLYAKDFARAIEAAHGIKD